MHQEEILQLMLFISDINGNLYDPFNGKKDLKEIGKIKFIGDAEKRIKEDYLKNY